MATVANGTTIQPILDTTQATQIVRGYITLSGNYGATSPSDTNGDTLNLAIYPTQSETAPVRVFIYEEPAAGTAPTGYVFEYGKGTDPTNGVLIVLQGGGGGAVSGLTAVTTMTTTTNAGVTNPVAINGGAVTSATGAAGVTGFTTTITGSGGSSTGAPNGQITRGAAYPAALVTAATAGYLKFEAIFPTGF